MIFLGLDPGYGRLGYGLIEKNNNWIKCLKYGVYETPANYPFVNRLEKIYDFVNLLVEQYKPNEAAVETLFFSKNVKTAIDVAQARGVMQLALIQKKIKAVDISPQQVKLALAGSGKASKIQVQSMCRRLLALKENPKPDDAADALALAVAALQSYPLRCLKQKVEKSSVKGCL
jgi:crossover junction endodeoxyribonuclease RuvC